MDGRRLTYRRRRAGPAGASPTRSPCTRRRARNIRPWSCRCCASTVACCAATCSTPPSPGRGAWWCYSPSPTRWSARCATPATCAARRCSATASTTMERQIMTAQELDDRLEAAIPIVRAAGRWRSTTSTTAASLAIEHKGQQDLVSIADRTVEELMRERLAVAFPGDAVLGEEGGGAGDAPRTWVLDPIDGTFNFLKGIPCWGVVAAYVVDGPDRDRPHLRPGPRRAVHRPARRRRLPQRRPDPRLRQPRRRHLVPGRRLQLPPAEGELRRHGRRGPAPMASSIAARLDRDPALLGRRRPLRRVRHALLLVLGLPRRA